MPRRIKISGYATDPLVHRILVPEPSLGCPDIPNWVQVTFLKSITSLQVPELSINESVAVQDEGEYLLTVYDRQIAAFRPTVLSADLPACSHSGPPVAHVTTIVTVRVSLTVLVCQPCVEIHKLPKFFMTIHI